MDIMPKVTFPARNFLIWVYIATFRHHSCIHTQSILANDTNKATTLYPWTLDEGFTWYITASIGLGAIWRNRSATCK